MSEIIPTIGASGYYELAAPLDSLLVVGESYTCRALRKLSDYLSNNEDPKVDIYGKYSIVDPAYETDLAADIVIASLQSAKGHWLYVPVNLILKYPDTNGILYRTVAIGVSLPSMPVKTVLSFLETDISNLVSDMLGVTSSVKIVETSRPVLVDEATHLQLESDRLVLSSGRTTDRSRYITMLAEKQLLLDKLVALETYIEANYVP